MLNKKLLKYFYGKTIFTGNTSSYSNITFDKNISNAKYIEIYYSNNTYGSGIQFAKIDNPVGKIIRCDSVWHNKSTNVVYSSYATWEITATGMKSVEASGVAVGGNTAYGVSGNTIYIDKVIAYF